MKLTIGTAQFGSDYGVANTKGKINLKEVKGILELAKRSNIQSLDTAILYGDSEEILGSIGVEDWEITSKLPEIDLKEKSVRNIMFSYVNQSIKRLKVRYLYSILLHKPLQILDEGGQSIISVLKDLKSEGIVKKIGISVYDPEELELIWPYFKPDIVQAPYNIFDRRLKISEWLNKLFDNGILVDSRSAFLQGLLLMNFERQCETFPKWHNVWINWHRWLIKNNLSALEACLSFQFSQEKINKTIIGVDSEAQLREILSSSLKNSLTFPENLNIQDKNLIDPSFWKVK